MDNLKVRIEIIDPSNSLIPEYSTIGSSGMDLRSNVGVVIRKGKWKVIPCGFKIQIPTGYEGQIRPRSGSAAKFGLTVLNTPGTIDSDYRGEVKIILINLGPRRIEINKLERVAQLVICPVMRAELVVVKDLDKTERGTGGLGSTGVN